MMEKLKLIKIAVLTLLLFLVCGTITHAQVKNFKYKAAIQKIDSGGVYRIELSADLIAKSKQDFSDIRIVDNNGKFIAFALSKSLSLSFPDSYIDFPEIVQPQSVDTTTVFIAENKNLLNISELWIKLKKAEVNRTVNLSGSDDLAHWYAIKENVQLEEAGEDSKTDYQQKIDFPNNDYRYFKVEVDGKNKVPVKIIQAGIYTTNLNKLVYTNLPPAKLRATDTDKISHLTIDFNEGYLINKLHFNIASPKFYSRRVVVYSVHNNSNDQLIDTVISSNGSQDIFIVAKTSKLQIEVHNGDDNRLHITDKTSSQLKQYAVSYLETGHSYFFLTGDTKLSAPEYDLSFLSNRVYNQLPGIAHGDLIKNPDYQLHPVLKSSNRTFWLWCAILFVLIILSFLTFKMVKELK